MKTITFRIAPGLSGRKKAWNLERVEHFDGGAITSSSVAWFGSMKAAKAAAAHLCRRPIKLPYKITV